MQTASACAAGLATAPKGDVNTPLAEPCGEEKMAERGQVTVLVLGLALVVFATAGLAVDGTRAFLMRRSLQNAADSSAVAGAGELDADLYYASGGQRIELDAAAARQVAIELLAARGLKATVDVDATRRSVTVVLRGFIETSFLGVVGIDRVPVAANARAEPFAGAVP